MTSLLSFLNLVDGATVSETTGKPWAHIPRCKASDDGRESGHSSVDAYLQTKSLRIVAIGRTANPFVTMKPR